MGNQHTNPCTLSDRQILDAVKKYGSERKAAEALGIPRTTFQDHHHKAKARIFTSRAILQQSKVDLPKKGKVRRFIFTSAQDSTEVHEPFLENLEAYADYMDATILIGGFTYNKSLFEDHGKRSATFHPRVEPYLTNEQVNVADKLVFCGESNTRPTTVNPLSGFETYTRHMWGVFPHPRISMQSVATMFNAPAKLIMTTGAVTKPNYVPKMSGIRAEFHHVIGALLVEIDGNGDLFCRHLIAKRDGSFQDLTTMVSHGKVDPGPYRVEAITWGDIHLEMIDPVVKRGAWGNKGMLDRLHPRFQFMHDVLDFRRRNHHNIHDPFFRFKATRDFADCVREEIDNVGEFLTESSRNFCRTIVVESNHDLAFHRWLKEADFRSDPQNAVFFLEAQLELYRAMGREQEDFSIFEHMVRKQRTGLQDVVFLRETDSFVICPKTSGGIECALHGHKGANGMKGHFRAFARMGPKANVAHTHSAAIFEGIYCAGTSSKLDMGYNRGGLSSWNHSHIVTYPSGKRTIITMQGEKYCAE